MRINRNFKLPDKYTFDDWEMYDDGKYKHSNNRYFLIGEDFTPTSYIYAIQKIVWTIFYKGENDIIEPILSWNYASFGPPLKWASYIINGREE